MQKRSVMKKVFFSSLLILCALCSFAAEDPVPSAPPLVTPTANPPMPALTDPENWTMVVVGDTQCYTFCRRNHGILDIMFSWIVNHKQTLRIQQVLLTGDLVDQNRRLTRRFANGDHQSGPQQWQAISRALERLDGEIPYIVSTGNHDLGYRNSEDRSTELNRYFPADRNSRWEECLVEMGLDGTGQYTLENAAYQFTTPHGQKILIVSLGFSPTDKQIKWAKSVFDDPRYAGHFGILLTHGYLQGFNRGYIQQERYKITQKDGNTGKQIFEKLVRCTPTIRMVICGHSTTAENWLGSTSFQVSKNDAGRNVYEMMFNPQFIGDGSGGDGWIRLLEFSKDCKTVRVRTFSPLFALSGATRHLSWHTAPFNQFEFTIE